MLIAREKRKSNVAEYILYMWQVEDMLRAMQMDIELVNRNVVSQFGGDDATRKEISDYEERGGDEERARAGGEEHGERVDGVAFPFTP